jgi:hypothetical protein
MVEATYIDPEGRESNGSREGSGFVVTPDGLLLTAYHVVENAELIVVRLEGYEQELPASVVGWDSEVDLAILQLESNSETNYPWLPLADKGFTPKRGENVVALHWPEGSKHSRQVTENGGTINNTQVLIYRNVDLMQIDPVVTRGSSGGPVYRKKDRKVIGVVHGGHPKEPTSKMNFMVSIEEVYRRFGPPPEVPIPEGIGVAQMFQQQSSQQGQPSRRSRSPRADNGRNYPPMDIVFIIDTTLDQAFLDQRCAFVNATQAALISELGDQQARQLRTGVISYKSKLKRSLPVEQLVKAYPLGNPSDTSTILEKLPPATEQNNRRFPAPLEDALLMLDNQTWRDGSLRVAVTIGGRPAYRPAGSDWPDNVAATSTLGDWRQPFASLRTKLGLHSISVLCPIYWWPLDQWPSMVGPQVLQTHRMMSLQWSYLAKCWSEIGYSGMFEAEAVDPAQIARLISAGLTPKPS